MYTRLRSSVISSTGLVTVSHPRKRARFQIINEQHGKHSQEYISYLRNRGPNGHQTALGQKGEVIVAIKPLR
jgi:hypothetical protein